MFANKGREIQKRFFFFYDTQRLPFIDKRMEELVVSVFKVFITFTLFTMFTTTPRAHIYLYGRKGINTIRRNTRAVASSGFG